MPVASGYCAVCRRFVYDSGREVVSSCRPRGCSRAPWTLSIVEHRVEPELEETDGYCLVRKPWRLVMPGQVCRTLGDMLEGRLPRVLALGPPGTGKSMFLRIVEAAAPAAVVKAEPEALFSKWVGETERRFLEVLSRLESLEPSVLVVDEADKLLEPRDGHGDAAGGYGVIGSSLVNMLLRRLQAWSWQERNIGVVFASNKSLKGVDSALVRGERLESIYFPPPSPRAVELLASLYGKSLTEDEVVKLAAVGTYPNIVEYLRSGRMRRYVIKSWLRLYTADCSKTRPSRRLGREARFVFPEPPPAAFYVLSVAACVYEGGPRSLVALLEPTRVEDAVALAESLDSPLAVPYDPRIASTNVFENAEIPVILVGKGWPHSYPRLDISTIAGMVGGERAAKAALGLRSWSLDAVVARFYSVDGGRG